MAAAQSKQCSKCGQVKPADQFAPPRLECKVCEAARKKRWERENREHVRRRQRQWVAANPERSKAIKDRYYVANRAEILADLKAEYDSAPRAKCAYARGYYRKNSAVAKARRKAWVKANPLRAKVNWKNAKARRKNLPNTWTAAQARVALAHWEDACAACRTPFGIVAALHWDHWIPLIDSNCPGTVAGNMVPLCSDCNLTKNQRAADEWLRDRFGPAPGAKIARRIAAFINPLL